MRQLSDLKSPRGRNQVGGTRGTDRHLFCFAVQSSASESGPFRVSTIVSFLRQFPVLVATGMNQSVPRQLILYLGYISEAFGSTEVCLTNERARSSRSVTASISFSTWSICASKHKAVSSKSTPSSMWSIYHVTSTSSARECDGCITDVARLAPARAVLPRAPGVRACAVGRGASGGARSRRRVQRSALPAGPVARGGRGSDLRCAYFIRRLGLRHALLTPVVVEGGRSGGGDCGGLGGNRAPRGNCGG